jgi:hypothetical protein
MDDRFPVLPFIIAIAIAVVGLVAMWKVFTKAGKPGWAVLVPVYNLIVMLEIAGKPLWWIILFFVPVANVVVAFLTYLGVAHRFGKGTGFGIGLVLLPLIFFPILAFGDARYLGAEAGETRLSGGAMIAIGAVASIFLILPILAAVAIPAFVRYQMKVKTVEAEMALRTMVREVRAHQEKAASGEAPALESAGPTPPVGACCEAADGRCAPDPALWDHPTWRALGFLLPESHRYSYQYEVVEGGKGFVARAIGDLDCDGTYSTFELTGTFADDGSVQESASIRRVNETE